MTDGPAPEDGFLDIFRELLAVPSPPGREERLAAVVERRIADLGFAHERDPAGNVLVRIASSRDAPHAILAAHMDEIALVVTRMEGGRLAVARSGQLFPWKTGEGPVLVLGDHEDVPGVLGVAPGHSGDGESRFVSWDGASVRTGCSAERLAEAGVRPGSPLVPSMDSRGPVVFGDGDDPLVGAWTFDDRAGVATLLRLLAGIRSGSIKPSRPLVVAFTVHEEGGCHGAKVLCHRERPEIFIAVDGCPVVDGGNVTLDGGPCVWSKDVKANYDQEIVRVVLDAGAAANVPVQPAVHAAAYTDASAVYDVGAVPRVGVVGHVRENSHGYEVARLSVFEQTLSLLETVVERL